MVARSLRLDFQADDVIHQRSLADFAPPLQSQGDDRIDVDRDVDVRHLLVGQVDGKVDIDPHRLAQARLGPFQAFEGFLPTPADDANVYLDLIDVPRLDVRPRSVLVDAG